MATEKACETTTTMETYPEEILPPYSDLPPGYETNLSAHSLSSSTSQANDNDNGDGVEVETTIPDTHMHDVPFTPTTHLQIQTPGKNWLSLPFPPPRPDPIPIYDVFSNPSIPGYAVGSRGPSSVSASSSPSPDIPLYVSVRPERGSGSCFLVAGNGYHHYQHQKSGGDVFDPHDGRPKLSTTTYRFGPGKPPVVRVARHPGLGGGCNDGEEGDEEQAAVSFEVESFSKLSRSVDITGGATLLVTGKGAKKEKWEGEDQEESKLVWRYGSSKEKAAVHGVWSNIDVDGMKKGENEVTSLLILELQSRINSTSSAGASSSFSSSWMKKDKKKTHVRRVAQLVRSEALRSPGSSASTAGNGGRLEIDLSWCGEKNQEAVKVMVVTTALCMLKKEVDRRRAVQFAAMSSGLAAGA